jgi:Peptidase family M41
VPLVLGGLALYVLLPSLLSVFGSWRSLSHLADAEPRRPVSAPERDRFNYDKHSLLAHIMVATGGRAAEEVVYGDERTGAESDIRQATNLARNMVGRFGMSDEIGFLAVLPQDGSGSYPGYSEFSERTRQRIDEEMKRVVGEAYDEAVQLLSEDANGSRRSPMRSSAQRRSRNPRRTRRPASALRPRRRQPPKNKRRLILPAAARWQPWPLASWRASKGGTEHEDVDERQCAR